MCLFWEFTYTVFLLNVVLTTTAVTGYPSDACHTQHEHKDPLYIPTVTKTAHF